MSYQSTRGYKAGANSSIEFRPPSSRISEDELLVGSYENILARAYNLFRNNAIPSAISATFTNYIGGGGLTPVGVAQEALDVWNMWSSASGIQGGRGIIQDYRDIVAAQVESGDILLTTVTDRTLPADFIRTKIKLISGSRVRTPSYKSEDKNVVLGVKYNSQGKEIGYYVAKKDKISYQDKEEDFTFIPVRDRKTGRFISRLMRRPTKINPGQTRQLPIVTQIVQELEDDANLWDASIGGAQSKALLSVLLETENVDDIYGATKARDNADELTENTDNYGYDTPIGTLETGMIIPVRPGTRAVPISHSGNQDLDVLFHRTLLKVASSLGVPYELLFKDFSKTNFSSGKMGLDSFYRLQKMWTDGNKVTFTELFKLIIKEAELKGLIPEQDLSGLMWIGPAKVDVDPGKNSVAERNRLENGTLTQSEILAERGSTYKQHLQIKEKEGELNEKFGVQPEEEEQVEND